MRLRLRVDYGPAAAGATARIIEFRGMPHDWRVLIRWDRPSVNSPPTPTMTLAPHELDRFDVLPAPPRR
jgi:hypothetical protein